MGKPFSAADPDGPAYAVMIAKDKRLRAEREARQYDELSDTASTGSTTMGVGEAALDVKQRIANGGLRAGGKAVAKSAMKSALPLAGYLLDGADALTGYSADTSRGVSPSRAFLRNGRRVGSGVLGGVVGGATPAGPVGALAGSLLGPIVLETADYAVHAGKRQAKKIMRELDAMNSPAYWPTRRLSPY